MADQEMPKIPDDFPPHMRKWGCCGILATAIFTGSTFREAWEAYRAMGSYKGNWKGSIKNHQINPVIRKLNKGRSAAFKTRGETLRQWVNLHAQDGVTYFVHTTGHLQVIRDGWVYDQSGPVSINEHWGRQKRTKFAIARK